MVFVYICNHADYSKARDIISTLKKHVKVLTWDMMKSKSKNLSNIAKAIVIYIIPPKDFSETHPIIDMIDCRGKPSYIYFEKVHKISRLMPLSDKTMKVDYV